MPVKLSKKYTAFSDIFIAPQYSDITSRELVDTSSMLGPLKLALPVISANMPPITGVDMAVAMADSGGLAILPRFNSTQEAVSDFQDATSRSSGIVGVSIGVKSYDEDRFAALFQAGARLFCIDVAHGHHVFVKNMLYWIRNKYGRVDEGYVWNGKDDIPPIIIAGNVAYPQGVLDLQDWGCDIVKFGIGPGSACLTRKNTGVGVPQFGGLESTCNYCGNVGRPVPPIISDGGIVHRGDVPKALIFAHAVMIAKLIAGTTETPGCVYENDEGEWYKRFGGSSSGEHKVSHGGRNKFVEGHMMDVAFRGKVKYILNQIKESIQTAMSYAGVDSMRKFRTDVVYGEMTGGGKSESKL